MNDVDRISVVKRALEQLNSEAQHLLSHFKAQVSLENELEETGQKKISQQHMVVHESIMTKWQVVRTLFLLLVSNTKEYYRSDPYEKMNSIEIILAKLSVGDIPFNTQEFQFPFHLSSLLSGIKSSVRNYILITAPSELENCSIFSPQSFVKQPNSTPQKSLGEPMSTQNVKLAAKKFQELSKTRLIAVEINNGRYMNDSNTMEQGIMKNNVDENSKRAKNSPIAPKMNHDYQKTSSPAQDKSEFLQNLEANKDADIKPTGIIKRNSVPVSNNQTFGRLEAELLNINKVPEHAIVRKASAASNSDRSSINIAPSLISIPKELNIGSLAKRGSIKNRTPVDPDDFENPFRSGITDSVSKKVQLESRLTTESIETPNLIESRKASLISPEGDNQETKLELSSIQEKIRPSSRKLSKSEDRTSFLNNGLQDYNQTTVGHPVQNDESLFDFYSNNAADEEQWPVERPSATFPQYTQVGKTRSDSDSSTKTIVRSQIIPENTHRQRSGTLTKEIDSSFFSSSNTQQNTGVLNLPKKVSLVDSSFQAPLYDYKNSSSPINSDHGIRETTEINSNELKQLDISSSNPSDVGLEHFDPKFISQENLSFVEDTSNREKDSPLLLDNRNNNNNNSEHHSTVHSNIEMKKEPNSLEHEILRLSAAPSINKATKPTRPSSSAQTKNLVELKSSTDQVSKRSQQISSIMISDKDYILGLMFAAEGKSFALNDDNDDLKTPSKTSDLYSSLALHIHPSSKKHDSPMNASMDPDVRENSRISANYDQHMNTSYDHKFQPRSDSATKAIETNSSQKKLEESQTAYTALRVTQPISSPTTYTENSGTSNCIPSHKLFPFNHVSNNIQLLLIPLNGMFNMKLLDMGVSHRFGRNNTTKHPFFKAFGTLVVSRNHLDIFSRNGKVYIKDIGSNSGTFRNNARLSQPSKTSIDVELQTGDYIQLGKEFLLEDNALDSTGKIQARKRCVKFQVVVIPPGKTAEESVFYQPIPIENPVNMSEEENLGELIDETEEDSEIAKSENIKDYNTTHQKPIIQQKQPIEVQAQSKDVSLATVNQQAMKKLAVSLKLEGGASKDTTDVNQMFQYEINYMISGDKAKKLQLSTLSGLLLLDTKLKQWEEQCHLSIQDETNATNSIDIFLETNNGAKSPRKLKSFAALPWQVQNTTGKNIGRLIFANDMKLEIHPNQQNIDFHYVLIGNFKDQRFVCVKKSHKSRGQKLVGEGKGRSQSKKTLRETQYLLHLDIEDVELKSMVLGGVFMLLLLNAI